MDIQCTENKYITTNAIRLLRRRHAALRAVFYFAQNLSYPTRCSRRRLVFQLRQPLVLAHKVGRRMRGKQQGILGPCKLGLFIYQFLNGRNKMTCF
jgi:hypothetical protein